MKSKTILGADGTTEMRENTVGIAICFQKPVR